MDMMQANREWSARPADERFVNLTDMRADAIEAKDAAREKVISKKDLSFAANGNDIDVFGPNGNGYRPTHWSFSQICTEFGAPADYLRRQPADLACQNLNWGVSASPSADIKVMTECRNGERKIRAITGPDYGRVFDADVLKVVIEMFGDGVTGDFTVPGKWGKALDTITKEDTTLYRGDKSMFLFLADEKRKIHMDNRRNGESGGLSRGFMLSQSEVRAGSFKLWMFLFDYVCGNRIIWGAEEIQEVSLRHTKGIHERWEEQLKNFKAQLDAYVGESADKIEATIRAAQDAKMGKEDMAKFLDRHFTKAEAKAAALAHLSEEDRPMETLWDVVTGVTAYAKSITWMDTRSELERRAGGLLEAVRVR